MISSSDILKASLLIVDDQKANVSLLEQMLRDANDTLFTRLERRDCQGK
jgi:CheY-like chemotaxis protein